MLVRLLVECLYSLIFGYQVEVEFEGDDVKEIDESALHNISQSADDTIEDDDSEQEAEPDTTTPENPEDSTTDLSNASSKTDKHEHVIPQQSEGAETSNSLAVTQKSSPSRKRRSGGTSEESTDKQGSAAKSKRKSKQQLKTASGTFKVDSCQSGMSTKSV